MLALQCEHHQGEKQLSGQQTLSELGSIQERWLNRSLQLFRRHPSAGGIPPQGQQAQRELDEVLSELLKELDIKVNGEDGESRCHIKWHSVTLTAITKPSVYIGFVFSWHEYHSFELIILDYIAEHCCCRLPRPVDVSVQFDGVLGFQTRCSDWTARADVRLWLVRVGESAAQLAEFGWRSSAALLQQNGQE